MPFSIKIKSKHKKQLRVTLEGRPYMDSIIELSAIPIEPGDSLEISVNLNIEMEIDGMFRDAYNDNYTYVFKDFEKSMQVQFIRFTKYKKQARIECFSKFPPLETLYQPKWNATRIKEGLHTKNYK